jgi:hypothetical protein
MEASPNKYIYVSIITYGAKKKMKKNKIAKSWESLSVENDPVSYYDHKAANMGNQYYGIPFACIL